MPTIRPCNFIVLGFIAACARTEYLSTGPQLPARPDGCDVRVYTTGPPQAFTEVGVVEYSTAGGGWAGKPTTVLEAKNRAAPFVCKAGGTGIVLPASDQGVYSRATVIAEGPH